MRSTGNCYPPMWHHVLYRATDDVPRLLVSAARAAAPPCPVAACSVNTHPINLPPPSPFPVRSHARLYSAEGKVLCGGTFRGPPLSLRSLAGGVSVCTRALGGGHAAQRLAGRRFR